MQPYRGTVVLAIVIAIVMALSSPGARGQETSIIDLAIPGHEYGFARRVNDEGQVLLQNAIDSSSPQFASYLWSTATGPIPIEPVFGHSRILGIDLNGAGQVVGVALSLDGAAPGQISFLWSEADGAIDLGVFGSSSQPMAINELGEAAGIANVSDPGFSMPRAFRWTLSTGALDLGDLGGGRAVAVDLNDLGQVVGFSDVLPWSPGVPSDAHAVLWESDGSIVNLGKLDDVPSRALAINEIGQVTGVSQDESSQFGGFFWSAETGMLDLGTLGGPSTHPTSINNLGQVVGWSEDESSRERAFLWTRESGLTQLELPGSFFSRATAINDFGQVVGEMYLGDSVWHAFLWSEETGMVDLGVLDGPFTRSRAWAVNNAGLAVGDSSGYLPDVGWIYHPVVWEIPVPDPTPEQQIEEIVEDLTELATGGVLNEGELDALGSTLEAVTHSLERGNTIAATNLLTAFQNQIQAKVNAGILTAEEGQALIDAAAAVIP